MAASLDYLREMNMVTVTLRLLMACICGGLVGIERGHRHQGAGLRTYLLVCMGSASVMLVNEYAMAHFGSTDPTRLGAQVISGIGFLGAGTIIVTRRSQVRGLTTAASLWASACMGLAIGIGFYECALVMCAMMIIALLALTPFDERHVKTPSVILLYIEVTKDAGLGAIFHNIRTIGWTVREARELNTDNPNILAMNLELTGENIAVHYEDKLEELRKKEGILRVEEL